MDITSVPPAGRSTARTVGGGRGEGERIDGTAGREDDAGEKDVMFLLLQAISYP